MRTVKVEEIKNDRIFALENGNLKCFLLDKINKGWFDLNTHGISYRTYVPKVDFSVNLDTVLNLLAVTHPVHSINFDGKKFNFYRKN